MSDVCLDRKFVIHHTLNKGRHLITALVHRFGGWWLAVGGWWLVVGGWWLGTDLLCNAVPPPNHPATTVLHHLCAVLLTVELTGQIDNQQT